jgi:hypothetical protein
MLTASARATRAFIGATFTALVLALYTGCGDQSTERKGGGDLPDLSAAGSSSEAGAGGAPSAGPVLWCDAYKVINCVCQQCHQNPTLNGAAMSLMTYEDTQAPFPLKTSSTLVWQKMQGAIASGSMPDTGLSVVPAVKPLSQAQRNTLLDWFAQGAHDEGGRDCPTTCDWSKGSSNP